MGCDSKVNDPVQCEIPLAYNGEFLAQGKCQVNQNSDNAEYSDRTTYQDPNIHGYQQNRMSFNMFKAAISTIVYQILSLAFTLKSGGLRARV